MVSDGLSELSVDEGDGLVTVQGVVPYQDHLEEYINLMYWYLHAGAASHCEKVLKHADIVTKANTQGLLTMKS